ncbi:MAG: hypothetical protein IT285_14285 [Bdellovibrionales bacterium]|nr:hypothetical protein [Bdellovibrionales bacterium]
MAGALRVAAMIATIAAAAGPARSAQARFSLYGGLSQLSGDAHSGFEKSGTTLGFEVSESVKPFFEPGVFLDLTKMTTATDQFGGLAFGGAFARFQVPKLLGFFVQGQAGFTYGTGQADSSMAPGFGGAAGFRFKVGKKLMIGPRVAYRNLTSEIGTSPSPTRTSTDFGLMITIGQTGKK